MTRAARFRALLAVCVSPLVLMLVVPDTALVAGQHVAPAAYPLPYRTTSAEVSWDLELTVLNLVNQERVAVGLNPLMPHATMRSAARAHGVEMFSFGYLSHRSRDGRLPQQRVLERRVRVRIVGENLAYAPDVLAAHEALMASEAHRQNILSPDYYLIGIGVLDGGAYGVIIVQNFADGPSLLQQQRFTRPVNRPTAFAPRGGPASAAGWPPVPEARKSGH